MMIREGGPGRAEVEVEVESEKAQQNEAFGLQQYESFLIILPRLFSTHTHTHTHTRSHNSVCIRV
jgi:hypothetical protein